MTLLRARSAAMIVALVTVAACVSPSDPSESGTTVSAPGDAGMNASTEPTGTEPVEPDQIDEPSTTSTDSAAPSPDVDVSVTAQGFGGCIDSVSTTDLDIDSDNGWATFDVVLDNNCGDPGRFVVFAPPASSEWTRTSDDESVRVQGPLCDEPIVCADERRAVSLDEPGDPAVAFAVDRLVSVNELIDRSPINVSVTAIYDYATDLLDDEMFDIELTLSIVPATPIPSGATTPIDTGTNSVTMVGGGFDLLEFPVAAFADTPDELAQVFAGTSLDTNELSIDWAGSGVVVFTIPTNSCPPVLSTLDVADGVATPVFENPGYNFCNDPLWSHTMIAAVDRSVLADVDQLVLPSNDTHFVNDVTALVDASPPIDGEPPAAVNVEFGGVRGRVPLPAVGEAVVAHLDNGAPVFVVRHHDGTVSALDARAGTPNETPNGIFGLATWVAPTRNFIATGVWDEYGRRSDGLRSSDMVGYATRVVTGDGQPVVEIGEVVTSPAGSPITVSADPPAMQDRSVELTEPIDLDAALALPVGSAAIVDANVVVDPSGGFVCTQPAEQTFPLEPCSPGSAELDGSVAQEGARSVFYGPLLVTRTENGFVRIASSGARSGQAL